MGVRGRSTRNARQDRGLGPPRARPARGCPSRPDAILAAPMSRNLVELVRRTHAVDAPTAIEVLKAAMEDHGEITDEDRRAASAASGLPGGGGLRRLDLLRRPRRPRADAVTFACAPAPRASRRPATRTSTSCARGSGLKIGERLADGSLSLGETVCLGFCHSSPAIRDGDVVDAGPDAVARVLAGAGRGAPEPDWRSMLDEPVLTVPGDWSALEHALARPYPGEPAGGGQGGARSAGAAAPASRRATSGASRAPRRGSRSSSSPTATRAIRAPTSTST